MSKSAEQAAKVLQDILSGLSVEDMIGELMTREGIARYDVKDGERYTIQKTGIETTNLETYLGPVTIITVVDP